MEFDEKFQFLIRKLNLVLDLIPDDQKMRSVMAHIYGLYLGRVSYERSLSGLHAVERNLEMRAGKLVDLDQVHQELTRTDGISHICEDYRSVIRRVLSKEALDDEEEYSAVSSFLNEFGPDNEFGADAYSHLKRLDERREQERYHESFLKRYPPPFDSLEEELVSFLRRKVELIVENAATAELESEVRQEWESRVHELNPSHVGVPVLRRVDRELNEVLKRVVLRVDWPELRRTLQREFVYWRVTAKILKEALPVSDPEILVFEPGSTLLDEVFEVVLARPRDRVQFRGARVSDAAQALADFTKWRVRVPARLSRRELRNEPEVAQRHLLQLTGVLERTLQRSNVRVERTRRGVLFFADASSEVSVARKLEITEEDKALAAESMSTDRFWKIIARARRGAGTPEEVAFSVKSTVSRMEKREMIGFQLRLEERLAESYRWDLWAVAFIARGGCSDDSFMDFRGWLIAQGREYFEAAMQDPERAADRAETGPFANACQDMLDVAWEPLQERFQEEIPLLFSGPREPLGRRWREEDLPELFPRLVEKFKPLWSWKGDRPEERGEGRSGE